VTAFYAVEPQSVGRVTTGQRFRNGRSAPRRKWLSRVDRRIRDGFKEIDMPKQSGKRKQKGTSGRNNKKGSSKAGSQKQENGAAAETRAPEEQ
jgi:hypothetical protein